MIPRIVSGRQSLKFDNPLDLINQIMQGPAEEVATDYAVDLVYEIASSPGLSEAQKIERIKVTLDEYRASVLRYMAQSGDVGKMA